MLFIREWRLDINQGFVILLVNDNLIQIKKRIQEMKIRITRKRTESPKIKLHSQQSKKIPSTKTIIHSFQQNIVKRRFATLENLSYHQSLEKIKVQSLSNLQEAKQAYKDKQIAKAITIFKTLLKTMPKEIQIPYYLGSSFLSQANYEKSIYYFNSCLSINPSFNANVYLYLAVAFKNLKKYRNGIKILDECLYFFPQYHDSYFYKGKLHMKLQQHQQAIKCFEECLHLKKKNQLAIMFLSDNYKQLKQYQKCLKILDGASNTFGQNSQILLRKLAIHLQLNQLKQAKQIIQKIPKEAKQSEFYLYEGIINHRERNNEIAITCLENCLSSKTSSQINFKAINQLLQISVEEKDFFQGEYLLARAQQLQIDEFEILYLKNIILGVCDMIKRKFADARTRFQIILRRLETNKIQEAQEKYIIENTYPYYAYCLFVLEEYANAIKTLNKIVAINPALSNEQYNLFICQGFLLNKQQKYIEARSKFQQACMVMQRKIQPYFFIGINQVQLYKLNKDKGKQQIQHFDKVLSTFQAAQKTAQCSSLFYFYKALVQLYLAKPALPSINRAIQLNQEPVSEYFFIKSLCLFLDNNLLEGLHAINRAIQTDDTISQFYKQRSKHFFQLQRFPQAIADAKKALEQGQDQETKLLLSFYTYMDSQYQQSYKYLKEILQQNKSKSQSFAQFRQAIQLHLGLFDKIGIIGPILDNIVNGTSISQEYIKQFNSFISQKLQYGQFTVYFYHLLISSFYIYSCRQIEATEHLMKAIDYIEQMTQNSNQDNLDITIKSQIMINQVKFNLIICSLMNNNIDQTNKLISSSKSVTLNQEVSTAIQIISKLISKTYLSDNTHNSTQKQQQLKTPEIIQLLLFEDYSKISDLFPLIKIQIDNFTLITKLIMFYPPKMKFSIKPQFDPNFLFNFGLEKIDSKLSPPWLRVKNQQLLFTDEMLNQSVELSVTQKRSTPMLSHNLIKDAFKLDEKVEARLKQIMDKGK